MAFAKKEGFLFEDSSKNIFSKINLVNNLNLYEIQKLNEKYKELGLFIKQVRVDNFGNQKSSDDLISLNYLSKKRLLKRHSKMTVQQLYNKYYCIDPFSKKFNNFIAFNNEIEDDQILDNIDLLELKLNLEEIHQDYQKLESKRCKINKEEFKKLIINYIVKFNKYLEEEQYNEIYEKMSEKSSLVVELNDLDNLSKWPVSLLKEFKAEIEIVAISNILNFKCKKLKYKQNKNEQKKVENEKSKNKEEDDSDSSSSFSKSL